MPEASFEVALVACDPGRTGAEHVQFEIAPNPGVPAAPLREIASGGELSRVMLALLCAAHGGGSSTLVFDEIDAGIGGHTARAVGEQLRTLAEGRQILAITHLPQVASFAARHFTIAKDTAERANTCHRHPPGGRRGAWRARAHARRRRARRRRASACEGAPASGVSSPEADADAVAKLLAGDAPHAAREVVAELARETPVLISGTLTERCGGRVLLKAENLQRTGSFKLRGALNRVAGLEAGSAVVAGSAGNHAQALAYAASAHGVACEVFMPAEAAVAKVAAVQAYGGTVTLGGESVDDCVAAARERAAETGAVFVHPFDDPQVIVGQATLGLELLEQVADLGTVVVPLGGEGCSRGSRAW